MKRLILQLPKEFYTRKKICLPVTKYKSCRYCSRKKKQHGKIHKTTTQRITIVMVEAEGDAMC